MIRCKLRKYAIVLPLCAVFFTMLCTYTYLRFYNYFNSDYAEKLSPKGVFTELQVTEILMHQVMLLAFS